MSVRDIEVRLTGVEDSILDKLGYREFDVSVGGTLLDPKPEVIEKPLSGYSTDQIRGFADSLGGQGNPVSTFQLFISRLVDESLISNYNYWTLTRDNLVATCLPLEIKVEDSRYVVLLGVIKNELV